MQSAARKVLEENQRLRLLLKSKGVSEQEMESFNPFATPYNQHSCPSGSTAALSGLIGRKKSYRPSCSGSSGSGKRKSDAQPSTKTSYHRDHQRTPPRRVVEPARPLSTSQGRVQQHSASNTKPSQRPSNPVAGADSEGRSQGLTPIDTELTLEMPFPATITHGYNYVAQSPSQRDQVSPDYTPQSAPANITNFSSLLALPSPAPSHTFHDAQQQAFSSPSESRLPSDGFTSPSNPFAAHVSSTGLLPPEMQAQFMAALQQQTRQDHPLSASSHAAYVGGPDVKGMMFKTEE